MGVVWPCSRTFGLAPRNMNDCVGTPGNSGAGLIVLLLNGLTK